MESDLKKIAKIKLTPLVALQRTERWCAYQERSQFETLYKLYDFGMTTTEAEEIIARLIESNFLNEERFALSFARGKFRIKHWGRIKIIAELRARNVNDYCIKKGLSQISDSDYFVTLEKVILKKWRETKETDKAKKVFKVAQAVAAKGFEKDLIMDVIKKTEK